MAIAADVLIAGGGPAGASAAIALGRLGHAAVLAERVRFPRPHVGESLPPKIARFLRLLEVSDAVDRAGFLRMRGTTVHDGARTLTTDFDPEKRELGYQVDRARFDALLLDEARRLGVVVLDEVSVAEVVRDGSGCVVGARLGGAREGDTVECRFLIDATGTRGLLSRALGARRREDVRTVALTGYFQGARRPADFPAENTLFEVRPEGWIWSVLLADGRRNVTLGLDPSGIKAFGGSVLEGYMSAVASSVLLGDLIRGATLLGELAASDATWADSEYYAGDGFLLAGDAGAFIDPLTSHGVYKAIHSGISAATAVNTALEAPERAKVALEWYDQNQRRTCRRYGEGALSFYRTSCHSGSPFWRARTRPELSAEAAADPVVSARRARDVAAFLEAVRAPTAAGLVVKKRPGLAVETRPAPAGFQVVDRPVLTYAGDELLTHAPDLDVFALLEVLDGRPLERVFESYVERTGAPRGRELGRAIVGLLAELVGLEAVEHVA